MGLTAAEKKQYLRLGYVVKEGVFSQEAMRPLRDALTGIITCECKKLQAAGQLDDAFEHEPFERLSGFGGGSAGRRAARRLLSRRLILRRGAFSCSASDSSSASGAPPKQVRKASSSRQPMQANIATCVWEAALGRESGLAWVRSW